jgi:hypothetical protein
MKDKYKASPEDYETDRDEARDHEERMAEEKAKRIKRYVYTEAECRGINGWGL